MWLLPAQPSQPAAQLDPVSLSEWSPQPLPHPLACNMDSGPSCKARGCPGGRPLPLHGSMAGLTKQRQCCQSRLHGVAQLTTWAWQPCARVLGIYKRMGGIQSYSTKDLWNPQKTETVSAAAQCTERSASSFSMLLYTPPWRLGSHRKCFWWCSTPSCSARTRSGRSKSARSRAWPAVKQDSVKLLSSTGC